jgi:hypothetical protein
MTTEYPKPNSNQYCVSKDQLIRAYDGTLNESDLEEVNLHLQECELCLNQFDSILRSSSQTSLSLLETSDDFEPENDQLDAFLKRISMAHWRDLPDLGDQYKIIEKIGQGGMGEVKTDSP